MKTKIKIKNIAPCGMDCALCLGFQREKNRCPGCKEKYGDTPMEEVRCIIVKCAEKNDRFDLCFKCEKFPCRRIKQLDKRYRTKYNMSMMENLLYIKEKGIRQFVKQENEKWRCKECGSILCVHRKYCLNCQKTRC